MAGTTEAQVISVRANTDADFEIDGFAVDALGNATPALGWSEADSLEAIVWAGDDQADLLDLTATWIDAPSCRVKLAIAADQTAGLEFGVYPIEVTGIDFDTMARRRILDGWFEITEAPGSAAVIPTPYVSVRDMLDVARGWLPQIRFETGLANFTRQRSLACNWIDELILKNYRPWTRWNGHKNPYIDVGPLGMGEGYDPVMIGYLAANGLMIKPKTRLCAAYKACAYVCESMMTFEAADPYPARADWYHAKASQQVKGYRAEIDINGDGVPDFAFNLGVHSLR